MRRQGFAAALVTAALMAVVGGAQGAAAQEKTPVATGTGGAAASVDKLATDAAVRSLAQGGNAVDAAVAAAGVLGVVEPFSCGIGGGGFMVIRTPKGKVTTIDGRETAPKTMKSNVFIDPSTGQPLAFADARFSGLSAGVPGTPATWSKALRKFGTTTLRQALRPGIQVATNGYQVDQTFFNQVNDVRDYFDDVPSTAKLYLDPDGTPKDVGTTITNPDMAKTYGILGRKGTKRGFYRGAVAQATAEAAKNPPVSADANHVWRKGLMEPSDLKAYRAPERKPVVSGFRGYTVYGMGPPSSGGSTVAEVLNILNGYTPTTDKITTYHRMLEASRYAFADRNAYVGDPAFFDVPLEGLTSLSFAAERRALIGPRAATSPVDPGNPYDDQGSHRHGDKAHPPSADISHPRQSTTHLTVVDKHGMMVSYTFTIESIGGNAVTVPGYGFLLNNELTDFNFAPASPSRPDPNLPAGGKRPRSSMSPTIIEKDGKPFMAVGSPGGSTIIGTVLEILVNRIDLQETLPDAIAAPRAVERNNPTAQAEKAFQLSPEGEALYALGHRWSDPPGSGEIGAATGVEVHGSQLTAAAEPQRRGIGSAGVVTPGP